MGVEELTGGVARYEAAMRGVSEVSRYPVSFEDVPGGAKGFFSRTAGSSTSTPAASSSLSHFDSVARDGKCGNLSAASRYPSPLARSSSITLSLNSSE